MAERCLKCFRPISHCLCEYAKPEIDSGIKFVFLMHPKEARKQRTGTGRLSHIALKDSEILVGLDFSKDRRFMELINSDDFTFKVELQRMQKKAVSSLSDFSVEDLDEYYFSAPEDFLDDLDEVEEYNKFIIRILYTGEEIVDILSDMLKEVNEDG